MNDFPEVLAIRKKYYAENKKYRVMELDATKPEQIAAFPDNETAILVLEGIKKW